MIKNVAILWLAIMVGPCVVVAQQSLAYTEALAGYKEAITYFNQENYLEAERRFRNILKEKKHFADNEKYQEFTDAHYYLAVCAVELFQPNAEKLLVDFINLENHESSKKQKAYYHYGRLKFRERKYWEAEKYFFKSNPADLTKKELQEYKFQLGYCHFYDKEFDQAKGYFRQTIQVHNKYYYASNYYYGYINFVNGDYDDALASFDAIESSNTYKKIIPYYIAQIKYEKEQYPELVAYLTPMVDDRTQKYYPELNGLMGKAYFELNDYEKSAPHLSRYVTKARKVQKEDVYQLGFAYYQTKKYPEAIEEFRKLDDETDSLGQNALYLLADSYLKTDNKESARSAFMQSSELEHDKEIQKNALFNYAKLSYELGYNKAALSATKSYVEAYPYDANTKEAKELLTDLYVSSSDYKDALEVMESIEDKSTATKKAYQFVAYRRAVQLFNGASRSDDQYRDAIINFDKSLKFPIDEGLEAEAYYWKGESYYRLKEYQKANWQYAQFLRLVKTADVKLKQWLTVNANYSNAYSYLMRKDYGNALTYFNDATIAARGTKSPALKEQVIPDAYTRAGDCSFLLREYPKAMEAYNKAVASTNQPEKLNYANYQRGIVAGRMRNGQQKVTYLKKVASNSVYYDDALYEMGNAYFNLGDKTGAVSTYNKLLREYPQSPWVTRTYLKLGLLYYNGENYDQSATNYKKAYASATSNTDKASAMNGLKDLYTQTGNRKYLNVDGASIATDTERDSLSWASIDRLYQFGKVDEVLPRLNNYVDDFPNGLSIVTAHYFRGTIYFDKDEYDKALVDYNYLIEKSPNPYLQEVLVNASWIAYNVQKDFNQANQYYKQLLSSAVSRENLYLANAGLMRTYFLMGEIKETKSYAEYVVNSADSDEQAKVEATYYLAKVAYEEGNLADAYAKFKMTAEALNNEWGAESWYRLAEIKFRQDQFQESLDACFKVKDNASGYTYWYIKGFLLMADNYTKLDNAFQAKATLKSIIKNYKKDDELKREAVEKLAELEALEAENSNLIEENQKTIINDTATIEINAPN